MPLTPQQIVQEREVIKAAVGWFRIMNGLDDDEKAKFLKQNFGGDAEAEFRAQAKPAATTRRLDLRGSLDR
jgi:hypothetical protein